MALENLTQALGFTLQPGWCVDFKAGLRDFGAEVHDKSAVKLREPLLPHYSLDNAALEGLAGAEFEIRLGAGLDCWCRALNHRRARLNSRVGLAGDLR
jgi:hypothetical protein